jgi:hypothetical protein
LQFTTPGSDSVAPPLTYKLALAMSTELLEVKLALLPLAERVAPLATVNAPCSEDDPFVTVKEPLEIVRALLHRMLSTETAVEMTTLVPAPLVMMTLLVGPGTVPPTQFCALDHDVPSPSPFQTMD